MSDKDFVPQNKNNFVGTGYLVDKETIADKLKGYEVVEEKNIPSMLFPGKTYIRYINRGDKALRMGGLVIKINKETLILSNNGKNWPVNIKNNKIYRNYTENNTRNENLDFFNFLKEQIMDDEIRLRVKNKDNRWVSLEWNDLDKLYRRYKKVSVKG